MANSHNYYYRITLGNTLYSFSIHLICMDFVTYSHFFCKFQTKDNISLSFCRCSTFVCPTEILAFSERVEEFKKLNTEVIACSVDSHFTHLAWINTPRKEVNIEFSAYFLQNYYYHAK